MHSDGRYNGSLNNYTTLMKQALGPAPHDPAAAIAMHDHPDLQRVEQIDLPITSLPSIGKRILRHPFHLYIRAHHDHSQYVVVLSDHQDSMIQCLECLTMCYAKQLGVLAWE